MNKIVEWLKRYLPAEILSIIGALTGGMLVHFLFHNQVVTALGGTWGGNIGYYGQIIYSDTKKRKLKDGKTTLTGILKTFRNIVIEFGPAEYLDSFIIRPVAMYLFSVITGNIALGLLLGTIIANITFYLPTIIAYEFRKKYFKD